MSHKSAFWLVVSFLVVVAAVLLLLSPSIGVIFSLLVLFGIALVILLKPRLWEEARPHRKKKKTDDPLSPEGPISQASRMILERCDENDQRTTIIITHSPFVIGRGENCDFVVDKSMTTVGRRHCRIEYKDTTGNYYIEDLSSRNGTFINSSRIAPNTPTLMRSGCMIALDRYQYVFKPYIEG